MIFGAEFNAALGRLRDGGSARREPADGHPRGREPCCMAPIELARAVRLDHRAGEPGGAGACSGDLGAVVGEGDHRQRCRARRARG